MKKYTLAAAILSVTAGLIAGCGGGGSSSTQTTSVTGKVADGYLANATVFLDKNGNYQLDAGEPSTMSDANGNYTLNIDPADMGKYPIVAIATAGTTVDKDTNMPVTASYVLSMPANAVSGTVNSNFISPISSQLREMVETGKYATIQDAMTALSSKLGVPAGTNMLADYMATNNVGMHTAAQQIANLMETQAAQVMAASGSGAQANRYRGMMGTIFSNFTSFRGPGNTYSPSAQQNMISAMDAVLATIPANQAGMPLRNMSSAFRAGAGMMGR